MLSLLLQKSFISVRTGGITNISIARNGYERGMHEPLVYRQLI